MTLPQILAFAIVAGMMAIFVWGSFRYDLVAMLALLAAVLVGIVPADKAFSGFADDIVIIVASALLVSAAVAKSGVLEALLRRIAPYAHHAGSDGRARHAVTVLSAFVKNIGALAMMIPVAFQMARRTKTSPSRFLMPMAFGSLLGGLVTLVGTSPNIIVARLRGEMTGEPFGMFDFTPVGLGIAAAGVVFLILGYRLLPQRTGAAPPRSKRPSTSRTTSPRRASLPIPRWWAAPSRTCTGSGRMTVKVTGLIRNERRSARPLPDAVIRQDDILLLEGEPEELERLVAAAGSS